MHKEFTMADKRKPAEKPSKNRTSAKQQRQAREGENKPDASRSVGSLVEGGQNEFEGEPHYGYGSDQGQSQGGKRSK
jgi:hypothetical protein